MHLMTTGTLIAPEKTSIVIPSEERVCAGCGQPYRPFRLGGWLLQAPVCDCARAQTRQRERQEWQAYRTEQRRLQAGLTARLRQATFSSFAVSPVNQNAFQMCQSYAERWPVPAGTGEGGGLLLWGSPGVGKTHLAAALVNRMLERGARVRFCNVTQWLNRLRDEMRAGDPSEERPEDLGSIDLLVLDDLGAQKRTAWTLERIYQAVNQRYEELQPLVVTTNRNLNQLEQMLSFRIFSRLLEICVPLEVKGEDWRTKIARERQFRVAS
jgi:DNA replication protein DnaC